MAEPNTLKKPRIFISYRRDTELDEPLAHEVMKSLRQFCDVFIDRLITVGVEWAKEIERQLTTSDFLIVFLSEHSVQSEWVRGEIETAKRLAKEQNGKPKVLPVRVAYHEQLPYPLSTYLNPIEWTMWESDADTARLIAELTQAIQGHALPDQPALMPSEAIASLPTPTAQAQPRKFDPANLDLPEGTIDLESKFYVDRASDKIALSTIQRNGVHIVIKGPRQMGKSSLLIRTMKAAAEAGKHTVFLDYQQIEHETLTDADRFYRRLCDWVTDELGLKNRVDEFWDSPLGRNQKCKNYFTRYLLKELDAPLMLAMDETESLFDTNFQSDFFGMLRHWYNDRATSPILKRLDLVLVTSTEPYQLVNNLNQSPFNVGEVIELADFLPDQVHDLNERHGLPLDHAEEQRLMELLAGHPYLTRRALYLITSGRLTVAELFAKAADDHGPFGDHLRYHLFRIHDKEKLVKALREVLQYKTCDDNEIIFRLRGAGLIKREGQAIKSRCPLYETFFREQMR